MSQYIYMSRKYDKFVLNKFIERIEKNDILLAKRIPIEDIEHFTKVGEV